MEALHHPHASGFSLYDCITNYLSIQEMNCLSTFLCFPLSPKKNQLIDSLRKYPGTGYSFSDNRASARSPVKGTGAIRYFHRELSRNYKPESGAFINLFTSITANRKLLSNSLGISIPDNWDGINWMGKICNQLLSIPYLNKTLLEMGGNTDLIEEWKDIILSGRKRDQLQAELGKSMHLKFWEKMHLPSNKNGKLSN